jgi:para-aminobenzoate synthetase
MERSPDCIILSPGPGHPDNREDFGICSDILARFDKPILGICLGHQGIASSFGGIVKRALVPVHGLTEIINHDGSGHSLIVENDLPPCLKMTAWTDSGLIMGLEHISRKIFGVQFHPESICSEFGAELMSNFIRNTKYDI